MTRNILIIVLSLVILGAINWGMIGLIGFDLIAMTFDAYPILTRGVYILIGIAGVYLALVANKIFTLL